MQRFFVFVVLVVVALLAAMGMGFMGGTAIADEGNETNGTDDAIVDEISDELEGINASEVEQTIDSQTVVTDWEFDDGQFRVEFYAAEDTTLSVAESGTFEEGSGDFAYYTRDLPAGESVETFRVLEEEGAALTMATPRSQREERGGYLSTGPATEESDADDNPFETFGGESGLFFGVFMSVGLSGLGAFIVIRQEESGVIEA